MHAPGHTTATAGAIIPLWFAKLPDDASMRCLLCSSWQCVQLLQLLQQACEARLSLLLLLLLLLLGMLVIKCSNSWCRGDI
jgi:hypothetical protein